MLYAAIDIHRRTFHAAVLDVETGETSERRFGATREELNDWAMPLQGRLTAVAIEATNGWRWVRRELSARGFDVRLAVRPLFQPSRASSGPRSLLPPACQLAGTAASRSRSSGALGVFVGLALATARGSAD